MRRLPAPVSAAVTPIAYAPACPGCKACVPVRVVVKDFKRRRSLSRLWKANQDLIAIKVPARATTEQYELFARYQQSRHTGSDMALMGFYEYSAMVEDSPIDTFMVEYRDRAGALTAVCLDGPHTRTGFRRCIASSTQRARATALAIT